MHPAHIGHAFPALQTGLAAPHLWVANDAETKTHVRVDTMNLIRNYRNWRRYRDTVNELSRLTNRELSDLGITRAEIEHVASKGRR